MLCQGCEKLYLDLQQRDATRKLRTYNSPSELDLLALECSLCQLIREEVQELDDPETGSYCKEKWGSLWSKALEQSPIELYHAAIGGEHNLVIHCKIDVTNFSTYTEGPPCWGGDFPLGGIFVPPESPVSALVLGRPFKADRSKDDMINLARAWYATCATSHDECARNSRFRFMPKRVLELESASQIRLLTVPWGFYSKYAALSYCWGKKCDAFLLNFQNISSFSQKGLRPEQLPATLKDACELCFAIGIRFLWVDALCIIQDSEDDWVEQVAAMGKVYSGAELTIQASAGPGPEQSLFANRAWKSQSEAAMKCKDAQGLEHICIVRGRLDSMHNALDRRGWTLQEHLLSSRLLAFGKTEMSWECCTLHRNESGRLLTLDPTFGTIFPQPIRRRPNFHIDSIARSKKPNLKTLHRFWKQIVLDYSPRLLSVPGDKLPALSGLSWWLAQSSLRAEKDDYLAGLWRSQLPDGLLWYHCLPLGENAHRPQTYRAPSWSWASLDCEYLDWYELSDDEDRFIKVLDCQVTCSGPDVFGQVSDGYLRVSGPVRQGWLVPNNLWVETFDFWGDDWKEETAETHPGRLEPSLGCVRPDVYQDTRMPSIDRQPGWREQYATIGHCLRVGKRYGLLVEPISCGAGSTDDPTPCDWRRIGVVEFDEERGRKWWEGAPERELVLR